MAAPNYIVTPLDGGRPTGTSTIFQVIGKADTVFSTRMRVQRGQSHIQLAYANGILWADYCYSQDSPYKIWQLIAYGLSRINNPAVEHYLITNIVQETTQPLIARTLTANSSGHSYMAMDAQRHPAAFQEWMTTDQTPFVQQARLLGVPQRIIITNADIVLISIAPANTPNSSNHGHQAHYYPPQTPQNVPQVTLQPGQTPQPQGAYVEGPIAAHAPPGRHNIYCCQRNGRFWCWR